MELVNHKHVLPFLLFNVDQKFGRILNIKEESEKNILL